MLSSYEGQGIEKINIDGKWNEAGNGRNWFLELFFKYVVKINIVYNGKWIEWLCVAEDIKREEYGI